MEIDIDPYTIDQPGIKRVKLDGTTDIRQALLILGVVDATIHKRAPIHARSNSPTRRKVAGRSDDEGLCIYLSRQSVLPHIAERIEKALDDGKNAKYGKFPGDFSS